MKIFLDENLPRKLVGLLRAEGHDVEPVYTLRLQGLANSILLRPSAKRIGENSEMATTGLDGTLRVGGITSLNPPPIRNSS